MTCTCRPWDKTPPPNCPHHGMPERRPRVGDVVLYYEYEAAAQRDEPTAAIVSKVWSEGEVNLHVLLDSEDTPVERRHGVPWSRTPAAHCWLWPS